MRRVVVALAAFGMLAVGCDKGGGTEASPSESQPAPSSSSPVSPSPSAPQTAADCAKSADLKSSGQLAIGTGNPYTDEGFEGSVAYAVADQMGFGKDQVAWVAVPFNNSYKPGDKDFDFYIGQVSYRTERANAVDFSEGYYNVQQALVANKDSAIADATTFADLKDAKLGAQIGTTSYQYIVDNIQPSKQPSVYNNSNDVIAALSAGQIDGYLVDAPTAYVNVLQIAIELPGVQ